MRSSSNNLEPWHGSGYLASILQELWPAPAKLTGAPGRPTPSHDVLDFLVLPNERSARLLVPRRPRRVAASAIRNYKAATTRLERGKVSMMAAAAELGMGELLPSRLRIHRASIARHGVDRDVVGYLSQALGRELCCCLYIGVPRAVRKPILQLLTPAGDSIAFAKVGVDDFTRRLVRSEMAALQALSTGAWTSLQVPRLMHQGTWRGHELMVVESFPRQRERRLDRDVVESAMSELARSGHVTRATLAASTYWHRVRARADALDPSSHAEVIRAALIRLEAASGDHELEFGCWHGDWTPWNMRVSADRVMVWDWERLEADVPVGFDAVHFDVQSPVVLDATPAERAFAATRARAASVLAPLGVPAVSAPLVVTLYGLELAIRYLEDHEIEAGPTRMSRLAAWLPEVVSWVGTLADSSTA